MSIVCSCVCVHVHVCMRACVCCMTQSHGSCEYTVLDPASIQYNLSKVTTIWSQLFGLVRQVAQYAGVLYRRFDLIVYCRLDSRT